MSEDDITKLVKLVGIWHTCQGNGGNNITANRFNLELDDRLNLPNNPHSNLLSS
jgi:hypothetical protein